MEEQNFEPQPQDNSKTLLIIIGVLVVLLIASAGFAFWRINNLRLQTAEKQAEILRLQEEIDELKEEKERLREGIVNGVGAYDHSEYSPYSIEEEGLILPDLSGLDTYVNNDHNYSFKYDSNVLTCARDKDIKEDISPKQPVDFDEERRAINRIVCTGRCDIQPGYIDCSPPQIQISVHKNLTDAGLSNFCNKMLVPQRLEEDICSNIDYSIGDLPAIRDTLKYISYDEIIIDGVLHTRESFVQDIIYFAHNDKNYMINSITGLDSTEDRANIEAILSTFEFTD
jgi:hypothetical protein